MKTRLFKASTLLILGSWITGCSLVKSTTGGGFSTPGSANFSAVSSSSQSQGNTQSISVPTTNAVIGRVLNGFPATAGVTPTSTNFSKALKQVSSNLPTVSDPTQATGLDQIPLLVLGACADANPAIYNVNVNMSPASNMSTLVNAGVAMVNAHVAGLASNAAIASQVMQVFTTLVNNDIAAGANAQMTFVSVCMAAHSFGVGMVGF